MAVSGGRYKRDPANINTDAFLLRAVLPLSCVLIGIVVFLRS
jgi:hypothetical protein